MNPSRTQEESIVSVADIETKGFYCWSCQNGDSSSNDWLCSKCGSHNVMSAFMIDNPHVTADAWVTYGTITGKKLIVRNADSTDGSSFCVWTFYLPPNVIVADVGRNVVLSWGEE